VWQLGDWSAAMQAQQQCCSHTLSTCFTVHAALHGYSKLKQAACDAAGMSSHRAWQSAARQAVPPAACDSVPCTGNDGMLARRSCTSCAGMHAMTQFCAPWS
jgi:hypothetical protein